MRRSRRPLTKIKKKSLERLEGSAPKPSAGDFVPTRPHGTAIFVAGTLATKRLGERRCAPRRNRGPDPRRRHLRRDHIGPRQVDVAHRPCAVAVTANKPRVRAAALTTRRCVSRSRIMIGDRTSGRCHHPRAALELRTIGGNGGPRAGRGSAPGWRLGSICLDYAAVCLP